LATHAHHRENHFVIFSRAGLATKFENQQQNNATAKQK
jgi:hypothetical protein